MNTWEALYGPNVGYALELYERYMQDPQAVDPATRETFDRLATSGDIAEVAARLARPSSATMTEKNGSTTAGDHPSVSVNGSSVGNGVSITDRPSTASPDMVREIVAAARLARSIREYGHLAAQIDPLGAPRPGDPMINPETHDIDDDDLARLPGSIVFPTTGPQGENCRDAMRRLRDIYCGSIGYEFDHIHDYDERAWLHHAVETGSTAPRFTVEQRRALLQRLSEVEGFERFLHTAFQGQKRFSIEGNDALVPMLDQIVLDASCRGMREVTIGMAHRGRLNVLAHVLEKPYGAIFAKFQNPSVQDDSNHDTPAVSDEGWTGDVKYHLGWLRAVRAGPSGELVVTLADNPSHLEFVNPVVEGFARAAQDERHQPGAPRQDVDAALPITIHGDAAFPGEGVVAETLNLARLEGYSTGGTIRIIVNNQLGFTTDAAEGRSTLYASDLAKGFDVPIIHVNADDPEACLRATTLAFAYRDRFHRDVLIDLVGYRRWGHNEGDEPGFTQPTLYAQIRSHPTVRARYAEQLVAQGMVTQDDADGMMDGVLSHLRDVRDRGEDSQSLPETEGPEATSVLRRRVSVAELCRINEELLSYGEHFTPDPKLARLLERRRAALNREQGIDWALGEILALATILTDGTPIRLSGQDSQRGTFSQRHLVLHDANSGAAYSPLQHLSESRASFAVYNSPLTEAATIGFEYGYSVHSPETMVLWEAQYGDFANAGQVLIDQFLAAARAKWRQQPTLTLLLPHGYEGQGPEHSSARLERYLQMAAEDNVRIVNCTTAAQYFHLLRLQASSLSCDRRPLIVMSPKSLLRHPRAASSLQNLVDGRFHPVLDDSNGVQRANTVERLVLCSGKVAIDLTTTATTLPDPVPWVAVARVEQLYPFPEQELVEVIRGYPNLHEIIWLQEEPRNMGAWMYMAHRLEDLLPVGVTLGYIGRPERASTAEGAPDAHAREQSRILEAAFGGERRSNIETRGVQHVG